MVQDCSLASVPRPIRPDIAPYPAAVGNAQPPERGTNAQKCTIRLDQQPSCCTAEETVLGSLFDAVAPLASQAPQSAVESWSMRPVVDV